MGGNKVWWLEEGCTYSSRDLPWWHIKGTTFYRDEKEVGWTGIKVEDEGSYEHGDTGLRWSFTRTMIDKTYPHGIWGDLWEKAKFPLLKGFGSLIMQWIIPFCKYFKPLCKVDKFASIFSIHG